VQDIIPFCYILCEKNCIISRVDVDVMDTTNVDSKTARTLLQQPVNCTTEESGSEYTTLATPDIDMYRTHPTYHLECEPGQYSSGMKITNKVK